MFFLFAYYSSAFRDPSCNCDPCAPTHTLGRLSQHTAAVRGHREVLAVKAAARRSSFISFTKNVPSSNQ